MENQGKKNRFKIETITLTHETESICCDLSNDHLAHGQFPVGLLGLNNSNWPKPSEGFNPHIRLHQFKVKSKSSIHDKVGRFRLTHWLSVLWAPPLA